MSMLNTHVTCKRERERERKTENEASTNPTESLEATTVQRAQIMRRGFYTHAKRGRYRLNQPTHLVKKKRFFRDHVFIVKILFAPENPLFLFLSLF